MPDLSHQNPLVRRSWRARDDQELLWAQWNNDYIVFHRPSGRTHLINAASEILLREILLEPRTTEEIVCMLMGDDGAASNDDLVAEIDALLERLDELGLVSGT